MPDSTCFWISAKKLFIVRDGLLATLRPVDGALEDITRGVILQLAAELNIPARETPLTAYDLYTADECFLSGTGAELIPVQEVDDRVLQHCPGLIFSTLAKAFLEQVASECTSKEHAL